MNFHMYAYIYTYIHTYTHTYRHTYMHIVHTYIYTLIDYQTVLGCEHLGHIRVQRSQNRPCTRQTSVSDLSPSWLHLDVDVSFSAPWRPINELAPKENIE